MKSLSQHIMTLPELIAEKELTRRSEGRNMTKCEAKPMTEYTTGYDGTMGDLSSVKALPAPRNQLSLIGRRKRAYGTRRTERTICACVINVMSDTTGLTRRQGGSSTRAVAPQRRERNALKPCGELKSHLLSAKPLGGYIARRSSESLETAQKRTTRLSRRLDSKTAFPTERYGSY